MSKDSGYGPTPQVPIHEQQTLNEDTEKGKPEPPSEGHNKDRQAAPYSAFSPQRKWLILGILTAAGFLGPVSGAIYLPALQTLQYVFRASATAINATVCVFMVVFAIAPLAWAAGSDLGGRKTIYIVSLGIFIIANVLLASVPPHLAALFVLRIIQAIGSCGVTAVGAGGVADVFEPARRASALSIFLLGPQTGPIIGPMIGGNLADESKWRWIFGFLAIVCAVIYLCILFLLPETLRCLVGNGDVCNSRSWFVKPRFRERTRVDQKVYPKPPRLRPRILWKLLTHPSILIVNINGMNIFTAYYTMAITFPYVFAGYGFSEPEIGYAYLVPGISLVVGSLLAGYTSDLLRKLKAKETAGGKISPEDRIKQQIPGIVLSAAGILMYGWFVQKHLHSALVLFASALANSELTYLLAGLGMTFVFITSSSYQTECFPAYAASLIALAGLIRNPAAAVAAAVINDLVARMGYGWCFTGLAILDLLGVAGVLYIQHCNFHERLAALV